MASEPIQWQTPESFISGDTLLFSRNLPDYLPSDGWAIRLTVTQNMPNNAKMVAQVVSAADATNSYHTFNVPNFLVGLPSGVYVLSEEVFNANGNAALSIAAGEKHQIYFSASFNLSDSLDAGGATGPQQTEAQMMLAALRVSYMGLIQQQFQETDVQRNRFVLQSQTEVLTQIKYWKAVRAQEIQQERARNGKSPGNVQEAVFNIG